VGHNEENKEKIFKRNFLASAWAHGSGGKVLD
jgi:hypothetical protein